MKKDNLAQAYPLENVCTDKVSGHEHIHAANCGHKSFIHGDHICFQHDGHYHYMHDGHAHECSGPNATVNQPVRTTAKIVSLDAARTKKKKGQK